MIRAEQFKTLLENLEIGMSVTDSCELAGISREVFYKWRREDAAKADVIEIAILKSKRRNVGLIHKAAISDWRAAAWLLERKYPEEYSVKSKVEHTGKNGGPIKAETTRRFDFSKVTNENLAGLLKAISDSAGKPAGA